MRLLAGAVWFWLALVGNPLRDLRLLRAAETVPGQVIEAWEDAEAGEEGGTVWFHGAVYTFRLPDGTEISGATGSRTGRLRADLIDLDEPVSVEVEYDPADPTINRLKGEGSQSLLEWLLRKAGLGALLLAMFLAPGIIIIRHGIRDHMKHRALNP